MEQKGACHFMYLDHRITMKIARVLDMVDLSAMLMAPELYAD